MIDVIDLTLESDDPSLKKENLHQLTTRSKFSNNKENIIENGDELSGKNEKKGFQHESDAAKSSISSTAPSSKQIAAYIKARMNGVRSRTYKLEKVGYKEVVPTGRTIKKMPSWGGLWPPLRELMQNTIDHLNLFDCSTGRRHAALELKVDSIGSGDQSTISYHFLCDKAVICSIHAKGADELVIEQSYTFPLPSRALDTGVPDITKQGSSSAGGFGDGFKTAAVALHALGKTVFKGMQWTFETNDQKIKWDFVSREREAVGSFAKCEVLEVHISHTAKKNGKNNWMEQRITVRGIATAFLTEAVRKLQVFWDIDESNILSIPPSNHTGGGDYLAPLVAVKVVSVNDLGTSSSSISMKNKSKVAGSSLNEQSLPFPGVYIRGIWVRNPKIEDSIMSFNGPRLNVSGRDRNDVDDEELLDAVAYVLMKCTNRPLLRRLLESLRGFSASQSCSSTSSSTTTLSSSSSSSWLLKTPRFFNRILEKYKDFFLHEVFEVPVGSIFVSKKLTNSKDPFLSWAADFLKSQNAALFSVLPGSNKYLFEEVSEDELAEKCVKFLLADEKVLNKKSSEPAESTAIEPRTAIKKLMTFMGLAANIRVVFSPAVTIAFVYENMLFAPQTAFTRNYIIKVLNVVQSKMGNGNGYSYASLIQAIFETLDGSGSRVLSKDDINKVLLRAKSVEKESESFTRSTPAGSSSTAQPTDIIELSSPALTTNFNQSASPSKKNQKDIVESVSNTLKNEPKTRKRKSDEESNVLDLIMKAKKRAAAPGANGNIIPETAFVDDGAGNENCLKPTAQLQLIIAADIFGGGEIFADAKNAPILSSRSEGGQAEWPSKRCQRLLAIRTMCKKAVALIGKSIPSIESLLLRVKDGFDSNTSYEAFCNGNNIIVNFAAFLPKLKESHLQQSSTQSNSSSSAGGTYYSPRLLHDFVITVTHELAHLLEGSGGHGQAWRDTHMELLQQVYSSALECCTPGKNAWACSCTTTPIVFAACQSCTARK